MEDLKVPEWTLEGVLDEMERIDQTMKDRQFAFILGAGASFTSGIPTGQHLAETWLKDLHLRECSDGRPLSQWVNECGVGNGNLKLETAAEYYPQIFERRFDGDREAGYAELEAAMEGKSPSLGYSLLAEIIQHTRHKVIVTTNFDNLVADALAMHAHQTPLVVAHESLAGFVRPQLRRPLVAKIHRDLYLNPINDAIGVSTMEQSWKNALKKLFQYFTPVVVGYGGNDGSLMDMLMGLDRDDIAGRMIWCYRENSPPPQKALSVLQKHRGLLVKIAGFDEFMLQLADKLVDGFDVAAIAERTARLGQERAEIYRDQASKLSESSSRGSPAEQRAGEVLTQSVLSSNTWWSWDTRAKSEPDRDKRRQIYLEGLRNFPSSSELHGNFGNFLKQIGDYEAAEQMYARAIEINPDAALNYGNYANLLAYHLKEPEKAESMYRKALELNPNAVNPIGNYANFLVDQRPDYDTAEILYKRAIDIAPDNAVHIGNYASFIHEQRKDYSAAESMYKRALALDPIDTDVMNNYANLLSDHLKNEDLAEKLYKKCIDMEPKNSLFLGDYADFLLNKRKNYDAAEEMYKKAISADPKYVKNIENYATFLESIRKNHIAAAKMYKRALKLEPDNEKINNKYEELKKASDSKVI
jgi:tetratricopeptide (TPR) repeat protein